MQAESEIHLSEGPSRLFTGLARQKINNWSLQIYFNVSGGVYLLFLYIYLLLLSFLKTLVDSLLLLASFL